MRVEYIHKGCDGLIVGHDELRSFLNGGFNIGNGVALLLRHQRRHLCNVPTDLAVSTTALHSQGTLCKRVHRLR